MGAYPTAVDPHQFYGPSPWDVPHRISLTANYQFPDGRNLKPLTSGWGVSTITIYQSGYPMTVFTSAPFSAGGDYNADGDNLDYPNVTDYSQGNSFDDYLTNGVFSAGQFTAPAPGTNGNEKTGQFRQPDFLQSDLAFSRIPRSAKAWTSRSASSSTTSSTVETSICRTTCRHLDWQGAKPAAAAVVAIRRAPDLLRMEP